MMRPDKDIQYAPLLRWLIGIGVLLTGLFIVWQQGLIQMLIIGDKSRLSLVILMAFVVINVHVMYRVIGLSRELNAVNQARRLLLADETLLIMQGKSVSCCGKIPGDSLIARHVINLAGRLSIERAGQDLSQVQTHLLSAMDKRLRGGLKYGWMFADLMIKLGLIGTVVGFVYMLGSVASVDNYDISLMQDLLRNMSGGMRVALFTTLSGLVAGLLLGVQYQFLDRQTDELLAEIEELSEVHVLPALLRKPIQDTEV